jgi:hypothetical protein
LRREQIENLTMLVGTWRELFLRITSRKEK